MARELDGVMEIVRRAARELTGADGASFVLRDQDQCYYADENAIAPLWKGMRFPMDICVSGWVMLNRQPAVIEDIYSDPRAGGRLSADVRQEPGTGADSHTGAAGRHRHLLGDAACADRGGSGRAGGVGRHDLGGDRERAVVPGAGTAGPRTDACPGTGKQGTRVLFLRGLARPACAVMRGERLFPHPSRRAGGPPRRRGTGFLEPDRDLRGAHEHAHRVAAFALAALPRAVKQTNRRLGPARGDSGVGTPPGRPDAAGRAGGREGFSVEGDPVLLRIVLDNLLSNAWKFSSKRPDARIEVGRLETAGAATGNGAEKGDGKADVPTWFVRDNGAGFKMAYAERLFAPFQRLHSVEDFPGTGIGLATVQRIIRRHGGRIWVSDPRRRRDLLLHAERSRRRGPGVVGEIRSTNRLRRKEGSTNDRMIKATGGCGLVGASCLVLPSSFGFRASGFSLAAPHPAFGHPLPEGEGRGEGLTRSLARSTRRRSMDSLRPPAW